jgi:transcriptional regulator of acetoin/glycerol metabolism
MLPVPAARRLTMLATLTPAKARARILAALRRSGGNITHAAAALGVSRATLGRLLLRLGLAGEVAAAWPRADRG